MPVTSGFIPPTEMKELELYLVNSVTVRYSVVAATAFYTYDFLLTISDELNFIWVRGRRSEKRVPAIKALFFICRYATFGSIVTYTSLSLVPPSELSTPICFTIEMFAIIDKWVTVPVITLFTMLVISELGISSFLVYYDNLHLSDIVAALYETLGVCTGGTPKWFSIFLIPFMVFDCILFGLAMFKSFQHYRQVPDKNWSGVSALRILTRDSFVFFLINFMVFLFATITYSTGDIYLFQAIGGWQLVIPSVIAGRLVINIRRFYLEPDPNIPSFDSTGSSIELAELRRRAPRGGGNHF
ncbi:hypothetical protein SERLA73DRAFT_157492 [Serpula lacrymans var. lacrymans S7.3]|uniref:DUF6533 domain-containing protein n=1 Tax=Serpula lacrymans var. lacrymans (strain S7.3) TaxID=936435 RepID=F8QJA6_SERL3|nr:hypothetical protein SERLA73DRAFT_157492 [Serpula lacrymans var. lacrymans S7.3]